MEQLDKIYTLFNSLSNKIDIIKTDVDVIKERTSIYGRELIKVEQSSDKAHDRLNAIDIAIERLNISDKANENKWTRIIDTVFKIAMSVVVALLLYYMGVK